MGAQVIPFPSVAKALTADELGLDWGLAIDDSQWVNQVTVTSPNHPDYTVDNSDPLGTNFGVQIKPLTVDTALKDYADMVSMADQLVFNRARSLWAGDTITVPMHALSTARQDDVLAATEVSSAWQLPSLTPGAPTLTFLEGYRERITNSTWTISAYLPTSALPGSRNAGRTSTQRSPGRMLTPPSRGRIFEARRFTANVRHDRSVRVDVPDQYGPGERRRDGH